MTGQAVDEHQRDLLTMGFYDEDKAPARPGVYVLRKGDVVKIGYSTNVRRRVHDIAGVQADGGKDMRLERVFETPSGEEARRLEAQLHQRFARQRTHREWFALTDGDVDWLKQHDTPSDVANERLGAWGLLVVFAALALFAHPAWWIGVALMALMIMAGGTRKR
jgi:hypothetical protein